MKNNEPKLVVEKQFKLLKQSIPKSFALSDNSEYSLKKFLDPYSDLDWLRHIFGKMCMQFVHNFLNNPQHKQTDKLTESLNFYGRGQKS